MNSVRGIVIGLGLCQKRLVKERLERNVSVRILVSESLYRGNENQVALGGGAVGAMLAISLSPMAMLLLYRLCLFVADVFAVFSVKGGGVSCFSAFSSVLDALISVYAVTTIIYILDIIVLVMGGEMVFAGL